MERELDPTRENDWEGVFIEEREQKDDLIYPYILRDMTADDSDENGIINTITYKRKFKRHFYFDDNLPIIFGTETELGFHFGKTLDLIKSQSFPHFPEAIYPFFLKSIADLTAAFVRNPSNPWLRMALNHYDADRAKALAKAAITDDPNELNDEDLKKKLLETRLTTRNLYFGEVGVFLPNASRLYVDGAHLEYSIAECRDPRDVICLEKAMESLLVQVKPEIEQYVGRQIYLLKDNSDRKGNSYACHANFLLGRKFFEQIYAGGIWSKSWVSFLVTSIIYTGSGKVGSECGGEPCDYQISQRADHFMRLFGMDTMSQRPIIHYRSEALSDDEKWGRLHVILHDSNMAEWSSYLKMGVQALVLNMIQAHFYSKIENDRYTKYTLRNPVMDLSTISRDLTCKKLLALVDGACEPKASPIKIQKIWHECAKKFYESRYYYPRWIYDVLWKWGQVLDWLEEDNPKLDSTLDWRIKKNLIERIMQKRAQNGQELQWSDGDIKDVDGLYHDLGPNGFYNRLLKAGQVERIVSDADILKARENAPDDTRAWARSQFIKHFLVYLLDVSWEMVAFEIKRSNGSGIIVKVDFEPLKGTRWMVKDMFSRHLSFEAFCWDYIEGFLNKQSPF